MKIEGSRTEANLKEAFAGESQARNKYTYFASVAKKEGYEQIASVFLETAEQEKDSISPAPAIKWLGASRWVPQWTPRLRAETVASSPPATSARRLRQNGGSPGQTGSSGRSATEMSIQGMPFFAMLQNPIPAQNRRER